MGAFRNNYLLVLTALFGLGGWVVNRWLSCIGPKKFCEFHNF